MQQLSDRLTAVQQEMYVRMSQGPAIATSVSAVHRAEPVSPSPSFSVFRGDRRPIQRIQAYDGKVPWPAYQAQFDIAASINGWDDFEKAKFLATSLTGPALSVLWNIPESQRNDYGRLIEALDARFNDGRSGEMAKVKLMGRSRRKGESLAELASDIESLVHQAYPNCDNSLWDTLARDYFLNSTEGDMKKTVKLSRPLTLQDALQAAQDYEAVTAADQPTAHHSSHRSFVREVHREHHGQDSPKFAVDSEVKKFMERLMEELKLQWKPGQPRNQSSGYGNADKGRSKAGCWTCGATDHYRQQCPQARNTALASPARADRQTSGN